MEDFAFKVNLVAVVRVRADDESVARKVVPTVLGVRWPRLSEQFFRVDKWKKGSWSVSCPSAPTF